MEKSNTLRSFYSSTDGFSRQGEIADPGLAGPLAIELSFARGASVEIISVVIHNRCSQLDRSISENLSPPYHAM